MGREGARMSEAEREREREREREHERARERERESVCVCVRNDTVVPGFGLHENTCLHEQVLPAELARSVIH